MNNFEQKQNKLATYNFKYLNRIVFIHEYAPFGIASTPTLFYSSTASHKHVSLRFLWVPHHIVNSDQFYIEPNQKQIWHVSGGGGKLADENERLMMGAHVAHKSRLGFQHLRSSSQ